MKKLLITGANGFIAKNIARSLKRSGFFVIGTSRNPGAFPDYDEVVYGMLGEPLKNVFSKHEIDVVVHCAYDKDEADNIKNADGTYIWAKQAEENNVGLQIFMSSISAEADAAAPYGKKKYEVEKWFIEHDQVVFRLGLVVGSSGLFGRIISTVKKSPVIPLIDKGQTLMYLSDIDTICDIVRDTVLEKNKIERGRVWFLQQEKSVFFVDILREIRKQYNLQRIFIPVPYFIVSFIITVTEKCKFLKLGFSSNNLKGLRQARDKKFKSDLVSLGYSETPMEALIIKALGDEKTE
jgi:NADH dehydrogenase